MLRQADEGAESVIYNGASTFSSLLHFESRSLRDHDTSQPQRIEKWFELCAEMTRPHT